MNQYTKGEWKADFTRITGHCGISIDSPEHQVANVYLNQINSDWPDSLNRHENEEARANAHLIAAAKELYETGQQLLEVMCELCIRLNPQHANCQSCDEIEEYRKAFAKAEGVV